MARKAPTPAIQAVTSKHIRPKAEKPAATVVYLDPRGKHQLRQHAVDRGLTVRVHDLLLEAIEEWAERKGLPGPFRSPSSKRP